MLNILHEIYHDDIPSQQVLCCLENPENAEERKIRIQLRAVDEKIAEALIPSIEALADRQAEEAFYKGACFGAQLMAELMAQ